jgi:FAD/FMN-containing dehydrogenase
MISKNNILILIIRLEIINYKKHILVNWAENVSSKFNIIHYPTNEYELISVMKNIKNKIPFIISGGNHSWSPNKYLLGTNTVYSKSTQICVSLINLKGNISYDENSSVVTCLSGTPLGELLYFLAKRKRILATYPNSPFITVGGMIATCSHGAALNTGSVSDLVTNMTYILPGDNKCSHVPNNLLGAYASSMGQLGVVCEVSLKTIPISWLKQTTTNITRVSCINQLNNIINNCELLKIFWNPDTDMCEILEFVRLPNTTNDVISLYPCKIDHHFMVYQSQDLCEGINYAPELDTQFGVSKATLSLKNTTGYGHCQKQLECPQTITSFLDTEFVVSIKNLDDALTIIKSWIDKYNPKLSIDTIYLRFTSGDLLPWISPVKGNGIYVWIIVDIDFKNMPDYFAIFSILVNELWNKTHARPHMGKWNNIDRDRFIEMYGNDGLNFLELAKNLQ